MRDSQNVSSRAAPAPEGNAVSSPAAAAPAAAGFGAAPEFVHALAAMNVDRRAAVLHDLQKSSGNRAVSRLLQSEHASADGLLARQQRGAGLPSRRFQRPEVARLAEMIDHAGDEVLQTIKAALVAARRSGSSAVTLDIPVFRGTISARDVAGLTERLERRMNVAPATTNGSLAAPAGGGSPLGTGAAAPALPRSARADSAAPRRAAPRPALAQPEPAKGERQAPIADRSASPPGRASRG
jgi:hypothetical protein